MLLWSLSEQIYGVWQYGQDVLQAFFYGFRASGEIDDQGAPSHASDTTREHSHTRVLETDGS